jgi:ubiquinone biosynthesis protein
MRVISMSEGLGLMLDPEFRYLEFACPLIGSYWDKCRSPRAGVTRLGRAAAETVELGLGLPQRVGRLLGRVERGELQINVHHEGLDRLTREFEGMTNRLALALVLAASVMALAVSLGVHGLPGIEPYVRILLGLGFAFSLGFGVWLLASIWRSGRR